MFRHGAVEIIKNFSKTEIKKFEKFIVSPYFVSGRKIPLLFSGLKKLYPDFNKTDFTRKDLWSFCGFKGKYNDSTMRNLLSDLYGYALKFLTVENLFKKGKSEYFYLLDELKRKNLFSQIDKLISKYKGSEKSEFSTDPDKLLRNFMVSSVYYDSRVSHKVRQTKEKIEKDIDILRESIANLIGYAITQLSVAGFNENVAVDNYELKADSYKLADILKCIDVKRISGYLKGNFRYDYILEIYRNFLESYKDQDDKNKYFRYYDSVMKYSNRLSSEGLYSQFAFLTSYCVNKPDMSEFEFEIYRNVLVKIEFGEKTGIVMSYVLFRNVFLKAVNLKEFDWAEMFLIKYHDKLSLEFKSDIFNYGMSRIHFEKGSIDEAQLYLNKISRDISSVTNDAKILQLRIFLETGYYDNAYYFSESYLKFLKTFKLLSPARKLYYKNFVKVVREITLYATYRKKSSDLGLLRKNILNDKNIISQDWLLNIIEKLISGKMK